MKKNEYEKIRFDNETQFCRGGKEILWLFDDEVGLACYFYADLRWFNFIGFELGESCDLKIGSDSFIIGD